ncbi:MAG: CDP-alcohol phosphatidyltransferase family protein [Candidatus Bathyarchaeia archaeon]|jgi:phosphatidylglycerophosphate synthase
MRKLTFIPAVVSSFRIAVLPLFLYFYNAGNVALCLTLFAASALTDLLDGFLARKLKVTTNFGAHYDAATDFVLVIGVYAFFCLKGIYPAWLPLLIAVSFTVFLASSLYAKKLYDPIGRYTGSALYIGVVLTLVFPSQAMFSFVQYAFAGFFSVSLVSRALSFTRKRS